MECNMSIGNGLKNEFSKNTKIMKNKRDIFMRLTSHPYNHGMAEEWVKPKDSRVFLCVSFIFLITAVYLESPLFLSIPNKPKLSVPHFCNSHFTCSPWISLTSVRWQLIHSCPWYRLLSQCLYFWHCPSSGHLASQCSTQALLWLVLLKLWISGARSYSGFHILAYLPHSYVSETAFYLEHIFYSLSSEARM